ncbi:MAG: ABC transporter permease [Treponema sp.]|nr:ABC transporter permease [Treponema sp.]MCL2237315.1 ABC transporter permease [Treponema sp.]
MTGMLASTLLIVSPILIAAIGGMICERAGVVNIALEGLMSIGAMTAAVTHVLLETKIGFSIPLALIFASFCGGAFSLIHAFASVTLRADQVVSGTGINLLSAGLTVFVCQLIFRMDRSMSYRMGMPAGFLGIYPTVWIALFILAVTWFVLYKRPSGLRLRAAGEHPQALAAAGVNVIKIRYIAVFISGVLAGLAGACVVLTQDIQFTVNTINGKGFIALAAVSFGRWLPLGVFGASLLFGFSSSFAVNVLNIRTLDFLPSEVFNMMPYLITLLTLVVFSGKEYAPKAVGEPYDKTRN